MICPVCSSPTHVVETRSADDGATVRRRRACESCGHRLTTYERVVANRLWVRKRSGRRQRFEPSKLRGSLANVLHKRSVSGDALDALVDQVAAEVERSGGELPSDRLVELCLAGLDDLDHGAYLQYLGTLEPREAAISGPSLEGGSVRAASEDA